MSKVKNLTETGYINLTPIFSYSTSIFYFIDTVRNIGKTWSISRMAWRRAYKRGKKTILVRRFQKEAKAVAASMYESDDIRNFCTGLIPYNPETKKGNFKKRGRTFYIKRNKKWEWFLKVAYIGDTQSFRSADDVKCDLILYDEYTTTPEKQKYVRGNEAENFIDLVVSISRMHALKCVFCGNKESVNNPYYTYFDILPPPSNFEGIRTYKEGSIALYQRNTPIPDPKNIVFQNKLKKALKGTPYGAYLFHGAYKRESGFKWYTMPLEAKGYLQVRFNGALMRIKTYKDYFFIDNKPDVSLGVLTDILNGSNPYDTKINKRIHRPLLKDLEIAIAENRVRYNSQKTYETSQDFFRYLGIA